MIVVVSRVRVSFYYSWFLRGYIFFIRWFYIIYIEVVLSKVNGFK